MSLSPGDRLGVFEIVSALGAGGMGEVFRARDTRLGRDVALKILPDALASDAEHLVRFEREARALAALNHPNIGAIYGLEDVGSHKALVLELIDGTTLADRIAEGPLSLDDVRAVARQIADALEAAHDAGIIHRDLKPANIKLRLDGTVKVLDFGLAKAVEPGAHPDDRALANSPTITARATRAGVLLGTAAYMSPEQARGLRVDKRSDLWAFGCVVYEMLTGQLAFGGETVLDSIANVLHRDVDWSRLPAQTPVAIVRLLKRCLARDVKVRLRDAADARLEIDDAATHDETRSPSGAATASAARVPWFIAAGALVGAVVAVAWAAFAPGRGVQASAPVRYTIAAPDGYDLSNSFPAFAWSPDGQALVVVLGNPSLGTTQLAVRRTDDAELQPIRGSELGIQPFFLADGRVGFYRAGEIQAIDLAGGVAKTIVRATRDLSGASAGPDDSILFADRSEGGPFALMQAPASGGVRTVVAEPRTESGEIGLLWPHLLPDRQHVLLTVAHEEGHYSLDVLSMRDSARRKLVDEGFAGAYASGQLIYFKPAGPSDAAVGGIPGVLIAAPFDVGTLAVRGQPVTVVDELVASVRTRVRGIDVAAGGGSLAIGRRSARGNFTASLASVGRDQSVIRLGTWNMPFRTLTLSPDGQRVAAGTEGENRDVWLYDLSREIPSRVTIARAEEETPQWSPDGKRLAYATHAEGGKSQLIVATPDEGTTASLWATDGRMEHMHVNGWSPDGLTIYINVRAASEDVWTYSVKDKTAKALLHTAAAEFGAAPSPDGHWVAYVGDESGRRETYVTDATGSIRIQVSRDGGVEPMWSSDGRELFFRSLEGSTILGVSVQNGDPLRVGAPKPLVRFDFPVPAPIGRDRTYAVTPDGKRFIVIRLEGSPAPSPRVDVTLNWAAGLQRSAQPDR